MQICTACGFDANADGDHFCNLCGAELHEPQACVSETHDEILVDRTFAATSDIGRRHEKNEDAIGACLVDVAGSTLKVLVICDGVSTSWRPETASRLAVLGAIEETCRHLRAGGDRPSAVKAGLVAARDAVAMLEAEPGNPGKTPATTIVAAVVGEDRRVDFGWLGDSRLYWLAASGSRQLTRDDSWTNDATPAERRGLSPEEIRARAHMITRCLGGRRSGVRPHDPHVSAFEMQTAGVLLAATDGFYGDMPQPDEMAALAVSVGLGTVDALTLTRNLVVYSNNRGGRDNISVIALFVGEPAVASGASGAGAQAAGELVPGIQDTA